MNVIVFDSEELFCSDAFEILKKNLYAFSGKNSCNIISFSDAALLDEWLKHNKPDAVFIGVSSSQNDNFGIEYAKKLRKHFKALHIIFLSSDPKKVYEIFGDLLRPTDFVLRQDYENKLGLVLKEILSESAEASDIIKVKYGSSEYVLETDSIVTIQKEGRKTSITMLERKIDVSDSLSSILQKLNKSFVKIDKGTVINLNMIREAKYSEKKLIMVDKELVYMSRAAVKLIKASLKNAIGDGND